eukprot:6189269-Pleurochrysis_carterae.AAC.1
MSTVLLDLQFLVKVAAAILTIGVEVGEKKTKKFKEFKAQLQICHHVQGESSAPVLLNARHGRRDDALDDNLKMLSLSDAEEQVVPARFVQGGQD